MQEIPMTVEGEKALRAELDYLTKIKRPEIIDAIAEAREHGDLKENAEYHAAREQQGFCEGRIKEIESKLASARVIDIRKMENTGRVVFGSTVELYDINNDESLTYKIVGVDEADISKGSISFLSPIAKGLLGKEEGDSVSIVVPKGTLEFDITSVEYI